jgi:hypothetical protein
MLGGIKAWWAHHREEATLALTILIVSFLSFSLGRLSVTGGGMVSTGEELSQTANALSALSVETEAFVALKTGSKYYPRACAAAERIPEGDRVYFDSEVAAEASGYQKTANCR